MLIKEDLPTLERPINAYSGKVGVGNAEIWVLLQTNVAVLITIVAKVRISFELRVGGGVENPLSSAIRKV